MTHQVRIIESTKFHHAERQWRVEVGGHTLLRLTYGRTGGALKTATAADDRGKPVFANRVHLIVAMAVSFKNLADPRLNLWLKEDRKGRQFLEFSGEGSLDDFFGGTESIAAAMAAVLNGLARLNSASGRLACANGVLVAAA